MIVVVALYIAPYINAVVSYAQAASPSTPESAFRGEHVVIVPSNGCCDWTEILVFVRSQAFKVCLI